MGVESDLWGGPDGGGGGFRAASCTRGRGARQSFPGGDAPPAARGGPAFSAFSCYLCNVCVSRALASRRLCLSPHPGVRLPGDPRAPEGPAGFLLPWLSPVGSRWPVGDQGHLYVSLLAGCVSRAPLGVEEDQAARVCWASRETVWEREVFRVVNFMINVFRSLREKLGVVILDVWNLSEDWNGGYSRNPRFLGLLEDTGRKICFLVFPVFSGGSLVLVCSQKFWPLMGLASMGFTRTVIVCVLWWDKQHV